MQSALNTVPTRTISALGHDQVDLFGFSMGGMIAQEQPQLVR